MAVAVNYTDFAVRLIETEDALASIIVSTKEMLGDDDALDALMKEIAADPSSVLAYPKLKPYAKKIAEATLERNTARTALDTESKDLTPAQLKYAVRFKKQEDAFETERAIWRESEKAFKLTIDALNTRMDALELSSKWSYGKCVLHNKFGYGSIASPVVDGNIYVLFDYGPSCDVNLNTEPIHVKCTDITIEPRKSRRGHPNDIFRIKEIKSKQEIRITGSFQLQTYRPDLQACQQVMLRCNFNALSPQPNGIQPYGGLIQDISILSDLDIESRCTCGHNTECTIVRVRTFCDQLNDYTGPYPF